MGLKPINRRFLRKVHPRHRRFIHFLVALVCTVILLSTQFNFNVKTHHHRRLCSSASCQAHPNKFETSASIPGAIVIYVLTILYAFLGIAIVCDEHFMPALEEISEHLHLSEDVAGATFLAAAGSAPELFSNTVDTFAYENSIGVGTIVGSAMFNILVIIAAAAVVAPEPLKIDWRPFARDVSFYCGSIGLVFVFFWDGRVYWWESLLFVGFYLLYIAYMTQNDRIQSFLCSVDDDDRLEMTNKHSAASSRDSEQSENSALRAVIIDSGTNAPSATRRKFRAAVITVMIANRAGTHKRLRTISSQSRSRSRDSSQSSTQPLAATPTDAPGIVKFQGAVRAVLISKYLINQHKTNTIVPDNQVEEKKSNNSEDDAGCPTIEEEEEEDAAWYISYPSKVLECLSKPLVFFFKYTIPPCQEEGWKRWYMVSFATSIIWIALFAMAMVSFATWIGCLLNISPIVLGVTLLAVGTSVPDAIGSIIASREGMGGMACSNAIGSNVFDICFGLGVPWAIKTIFVRPGGFMAVKSNDLWEPISILFGTVIIVIIVFILTKFRLTKCMGATFVFLYFVYVIYQLWEGIMEALN